VEIVEPDHPARLIDANLEHHANARLAARRKFHRIPAPCIADSLARDLGVLGSRDPRVESGLEIPVL
jgi:hypothetical protein